MFSKKDVNTGRQQELDYMKGLFVPMILIIHAFQMLGGAFTAGSAYRIFYIAATMTGAALFMFILGIGTVYSKKSNKELALYGVKLVAMQILWNVLSLSLPMVLGQLIRIVFGFAPNWTETFMRIPVMAEYINVFFVAGMCYFVIVILRSVKLPAVGYIAIAGVLFAVNPSLYMIGKSTGNSIVDYVFQTFAGGRSSVSLCVISLMPHALLGVGFGKFLRRTENKGRLYGILAIPLSVIVIAYFVYAIATHPNLSTMYTYSDMGYVFPGVFRGFANAASVILLAGALWAVHGAIGKCKPLHNLFMHFCRNNTPYYAIHPFYFCLILAINSYAPFSEGFSIAMAAFVGILCYGTILLWKKIK